MINLHKLEINKLKVELKTTIDTLNQENLLTKDDLTTKHTFFKNQFNDIQKENVKLRQSLVNTEVRLQKSLDDLQKSISENTILRRDNIKRETQLNDILNKTKNERIEADKVRNHEGIVFVSVSLYIKFINLTFLYISH